MSRRLALALLAVLALGLGGCGGGGDETTTEGRGGSTQARTGQGEGPGGEAGGVQAAAKDPAPAHPVAEENRAQERRREARERAAYEHKRYGDPSKQSESFEKYSHQAGPHLHLAEFGAEADSEGRQEVSSIVSSYLAAIAAGHWERACESLAASLESLIPTNDPSSCGGALQSAVSAFERAAGRESISAPEGVASLRIQTGGRAGEGTGFALFHGSDGKDYWLAVKREGGEWRLISVVPQPLG